MFTGIIEDVGSLRRMGREQGRVLLEVETALPAEKLALGESVAVDGACLTVVSRGPGLFSVHATPETLQRTTLGAATPGRPVHIERALPLGARLSGHLVLGHVDAVGTVQRRRSGPAHLELEIALDRPWLELVVEKGSVALDGVSLTISGLKQTGFEVVLVPHTLEQTHIDSWQPGRRVNVETDIIGKYVARLMSAGRLDGELDLEFLARHGFA